jgi:hypothetical protein
VVAIEGTLLNNTFIHSTGSIDLHYLHTLHRSIYTRDRKCLHTLPQSYLGVAAAEEEEASVHSRAAVEEEVGVRVR